MRRAAQGSFGLVVAVGLAIAGVGWHRERAPQQRPAPLRVFCDIDELARYHPAWAQAEQVHAVLGGSGRIEPGRSPAAEMLDGRRSTAEWSVPEVDSGPRAVLQARLEEKAERELSRVGEELARSVSARLAERRDELEAKVDATEAEARRRMEHELAKDLRSLHEEHRFERVDAAIKLAAVKSQLSVPGVDTERVKAAIEAQERDFSTVRAALASDEERLRKRAQAALEDTRVRHRSAMERELVELRHRETSRIRDSIEECCERLRRELAANEMAALARDGWMGDEVRSARGRGLVARPAERLASRHRVTGLSERLANFERGLRARVTMEMEAVLRRIARDNGLEVTFDPAERAEDRTEWFRDRLPYIRMSNAECRMPNDECRILDSPFIILHSGGK